MTPEERKRMNAICIGIQEETNHDSFVTMLRELSELIAQKEQRRFQQYPPLIWKRDRPWKAVPAIVKKSVRSRFGNPDKVEIALSTEDDLFREYASKTRLQTPTVDRYRCQMEQKWS